MYIRYLLQRNDKGYVICFYEVLGLERSFWDVYIQGLCLKYLVIVKVLFGQNIY